YFARFRTPEPFPDFYDPVGSVDLERYRVSLLRMSLRCLRMITVIDDVRKYVMGSSAIAALNRVVDENPLDTFIRKDVKAIFKSTKVLSTEVLNTYYSLDVQLAGIKRLSYLFGQYTDLAQQALWALDVLSITDFNRITMKREKLKFVLSEVILGSKLIVPRRLRLLNWKDIGHDNDDDQHG
ncbi:hypothetical protein DYB28_014678, partial [Aphanomyces astaci]